MANTMDPLDNKYIAKRSRSSDIKAIVRCGMHFYTMQRWNGEISSTPAEARTVWKTVFNGYHQIIGRSGTLVAAHGLAQTCKAPLLSISHV